MLRFPSLAIIFSCKCLLAGMLALYIAFRAGLENPAWSVVTAYIVAQPHAGATVSKGIFRMCGTFVGACAAVFMVPPLVQTPALLCVAIALWLAVCVFLQLTDRTARGYLFVLAGYTSCIIIFPILNNPQNVFEYATSRFLEISLGIICGTIVHAVVLPVSTAKVVNMRLKKALADAQAVCADALFTREREKRVEQNRQKLAATVNDLHDLMLHQRFEGALQVSQLDRARFALSQIEHIIPLSLAVEDRIRELNRTGGIPQDVHGLLDETRDWFGTTDDPQGELGRVPELLSRCAGLRPDVNRSMTWADMLLLNLLERLSALIRLKERILESDNPGKLEAMVRAEPPRPRPIERDMLGAAGAGAAVALTFALAVALWIASGWEQGYSAAMMAGVYFSVYSNSTDPAQMLKSKFVGVFMRLLLGGVYVVLILPAISDFGAMVLALSPALLCSGAMMAIPRFSAMGFNLVIGVMSPSIVDRTFHTDFQLYLNAGIATLTGIYYAMLMVSVTRFLWLDGMVRRTLAAGRRDIARMRYLNPADILLWRSRMTHRIGLLVLRIAASPVAYLADEALRDMMTGGVLAQLNQACEEVTGSLGMALQSLVRQVVACYGTMQNATTAVFPETLRVQIDQCLREAVESPGTDSSLLLLLTSLRRSLFPGEHSAPTT
jgi:uncharacterized membrane protein YccC